MHLASRVERKKIREREHSFQRIVPVGNRSCNVRSVSYIAIVAMSPRSSYAALPHYDPDKDNEIGNYIGDRSPRKRFQHIWRDILIALLGATNLALIVLYVRSGTDRERPWSSSYSKMAAIGKGIGAHFSQPALISTLRNGFSTAGGQSMVLQTRIRQQRSMLLGKPSIRPMASLPSTINGLLSSNYRLPWISQVIKARECMSWRHITCSIAW